MKFFLKDPSISKLFDKYDLNLSGEKIEDVVDTISKVTLDIFGKTEKLDFFFLHGCTGWYALKNILPFIDDNGLKLKTAQIW
eukprot:gene3894-7107_t